MSPGCCSQAMLRGGSWARRPSDGAGSRPRCSIRIGRSCTTCAAPVQSGKQSMRAAQGAQARSRSNDILGQSIAERIERSHAYDLHPIRCQYGAHLHGAELAMASVNCGAPIVTRAQAENMLDEYFALAEQAIPLTEDNPLDRRS